MTHLFDGMAGLLNDTFGGPVVFLPVSGPARTVHSVFRERLVEVLSADGVPIMVEQPTWRVPEDLVPDAERGALIEVTMVTGELRRYRIVNRFRTSTPSPDATVIFALEAM